MNNLGCIKKIIHLLRLKEGEHMTEPKSDKKNKLKISILLFSIVMAFMYSMGIYDLFMMLSHNSVYYEAHGYNHLVVEYFTNYPIIFLVFWVTNLISGILSPLFILFHKNKKIGIRLALISAVSDFILLIATFLFRNRLEVLGKEVAFFDLFILLLSYGFYKFCKKVYSNEH